MQAIRSYAFIRIRDDKLHGPIRTMRYVTHTDALDPITRHKMNHNDFDWEEFERRLQEGEIACFVEPINIELRDGVPYSCTVTRIVKLKAKETADG